jgi:pimeloyl-ACP methyl ester carboxylesterase
VALAPRKEPGARLRAALSGPEVLGARPPADGAARLGSLEIEWTTGEPLLLLHGALSTIDTSFGAILPTLAETRRLVAVEQQGHGHTADVDRPLSYAQMAEDTAAVLREREIVARRGV